MSAPASSDDGCRRTRARRQPFEGCPRPLDAQVLRVIERIPAILATLRSGAANGCRSAQLALGAANRCEHAFATLIAHGMSKSVQDRRDQTSDWNTVAVARHPRRAVARRGTIAPDHNGTMSMWWSALPARGRHSIRDPGPADRRRGQGARRRSDGVDLGEHALHESQWIEQTTSRCRSDASRKAAMSAPGRDWQRCGCGRGRCSRCDRQLPIATQRCGHRRGGPVQHHRGTADQQRRCSPSCEYRWASRSCARSSTRRSAGTLHRGQHDVEGVDPWRLAHDGLSSATRRSLRSSRRSAPPPR